MYLGWTRSSSQNQTWTSSCSVFVEWLSDTSNIDTNWPALLMALMSSCLTFGANPKRMMCPVLSSPQVNDFDIQIWKHSLQNVSQVFVWVQWMVFLHAVWRHQNTSARSVALPPRATLMSVPEDEETEPPFVIAVASGAAVGGVTMLALGCGGATRLPQKPAMESCRSRWLAAV